MEMDASKWMNLSTLAKDSKYETTDSLYFRYALVHGLKKKHTDSPLCVLEYGTFLGCSAAWMASALEPGDMLITLERDGVRVAEAEQNIKNLGLQDIVTCLQMDTRFPAMQQIADMLGDPENGISIFSMDAAHDYAGCCLEYASAEFIITDAHVLLIDDTKVSGIRRFVQDMESRYRVSLHLDIHNGLAVMTDEPRLIMDLASVATATMAEDLEELTVNVRYKDWGAK